MRVIELLFPNQHPQFLEILEGWVDRLHTPIIFQEPYLEHSKQQISSYQNIVPSDGVKIPPLRRYIVFFAWMIELGVGLHKGRVKRL